MLIKRTAVCLFVFVIILLLGSIWNVRLEDQRRETLRHFPPAPSYSVLSKQQASERQPFVPFQPREYVRIVK